MHISKRDTISLSKAWSIRAIAILLALIVDGIIIYAIVKMNPPEGLRFPRLRRVRHEQAYVVHHP